jgi:spore maturation protein CgeB
MISSIIHEFQPDIVLVFKGEFLSRSTLSGLSENYPLYLFYPDMYKYKPLLKNRLQYFKAVFTAANRTKFYEELGAKKVVTVPWACDPEFHRRLAIGKKYDVTFIGSGYPERRRALRALSGVQVFGEFWLGYRGAKPPVFGENYIITINESKINLNIQAAANIIADAPTMRTFEISGCGGFQLTNEMPSIGKYFPIIPTFKDSKELRELVRYYLFNPAERDEIALKSQETCYRQFKYTDSAKIILSNL